MNFRLIILLVSTWTSRRKPRFQSVFIDKIEKAAYHCFEFDFFFCVCGEQWGALVEKKGLRSTDRGFSQVLPKMEGSYNKGKPTANDSARAASDCCYSLYKLYNVISSFTCHILHIQIHCQSSSSQNSSAATRNSSDDLFISFVICHFKFKFNY